MKKIVTTETIAFFMMALLILCGYSIGSDTGDFGESVPCIPHESVPGIPRESVPGNPVKVYQ